MAGYEFHKGLEAVWQFISCMNKYIDTQEPWRLAKDPEAQPKLSAVIRNLLEGLRTVACLIYPVMPETSKKMLEGLTISVPEAGFYGLDQMARWMQMPVGTCLEKPDSLFPRVDVGKKPGQ
jgi:methionyl-tRNA synthetase